MKSYFILVLFVISAVYLPYAHAGETKPIKYTFIVGNYLTPTVAKAIKTPGENIRSLKID